MTEMIEKPVNSLMDISSICMKTKTFCGNHRSNHKSEAKLRHK